jgi:hypothetical protein
LTNTLFFDWINRLFPAQVLSFQWMNMKKIISTDFKGYMGNTELDSEACSTTRNAGRQNMKKLMLIAAILLISFKMSFAQNSASQNVPLAATVIQGLSTTVSGEANFGTIVAGTTPNSLNAQSGTVGTNPGNIALVTVTGNGGQQITITFSATTLTGPGTALTFTPSVYGANSAAAQATSAQVSTNGTANLSGTTGSAGNYYFWVGGSLSALPQAQTPGSYSGTWTMSVTY